MFTISHTESEVRDFVREFDTPNTRLLLSYCESGQITWERASVVARRALVAGVAAAREVMAKG